MKNNLLHILMTILIVSGITQISLAQTCIDKTQTNTPWTYIPYFDGADSYITVREGSGDGAGNWFDHDFSFDMWIRPTFPQTATDHYVFFSVGTWCDDFNSMYVYFENYDNDKWRIRISDGTDNASTTDRFYYINYESDWHNKWKHITLTYDESQTKVRLYLNGAKVLDDSFRFDYTNWGHCVLGGDANNHDMDFRGYISGFRIWAGKKLTDSDVGYIWAKTFDGINTFVDNEQGLNQYLKINMYTSSDNIYSLVPDKQMNESGIIRSTSQHHPARPPRIRTLTASRQCTEIDLDWTIGTGATPLPTFYVYRKEDGQSGIGSLECRTNSTYYHDNDPDLEPGVDYVYTVESKWYNSDDPMGFNNGYYDSEDDLTVTTSLRKYPQVEGFQVSNEQCNGEVALEWNAPSVTPDSYYIKYKVENGSWQTLVDPLSNTATTYTHVVDPANYSKSISYKIDGGGDACINYSNIITGSGNRPCTKAPTNVKDTVIDESIRLTWDFDNDDGGGPQTDFKIYRRIGTSGAYDPLVDNISANDREYIDNEAEMCVDYYYKVEPYNNCNNNNNLPSSTATGSAINKPVQFDNVFTYVENSETKSYFDASKGYYNQKVTIDWTINPIKIGDVDTYEIYRKKAGQSYSLLASINNSNATYYEDNTTEANELYEYLIRALGDCAGVEKVSDSLTTIGFRSSTGIVAGKITYQGGNAVENAEVRIGSSESIPSHSLTFNGMNDYMGTNTFNDSIMFKPLSVEAWIKPELMQSQEKKIIFSGYSGIFYLALKDMHPICGVNANIIDGVNDENPIVTIESDTVLDAGTWYHLAINFLPATGQFQLYINGELAQEAIVNQAVDLSSLDLHGAYAFTVGSANGYTNFYAGNMDEIRIWQKFRDASEIKRDYIRILSGSEEKLMGYYRLDEGYGTAAYDISKKDGAFNKNHLEIPNGNEEYFPEWSPQTPSFEQLHPSGITDANGNYVIKGVRYSGSGNVFGVSPFLGVHEFNPTDVNLFIGDSEPVHNNIDFIDKSSFRVTGLISYQNTNMPVAGAFIKIDGSFIQGSNNQVVTSDSHGQFDIQVPIGEHYITVEKQGHTFVSAYYPSQNSDTTITKYFFNEPIYNVQFYDNTTVKLAGRVVGGAVEEAKDLGSVNNPTVNNLGTCKITFTTEQGYILDLEHNLTTFVVYTDSLTGLYEINLPPEVYKVDTVKVNNTYNFLVGESELVTLSNCFQEQYTTDSVTTEEGEQVLDTVYTYNLEKNWIWRSTPQISVDNTEGTKFLGDSEAIMNVGSENQDTIQIASMVADTANYVFGKPVYSLGKKYELVVSAFETYINNDSGEIDTVVVSDGEVHIINECANNQNQIVLDFNDEGQTLYQFFGGFPNLSSPYTKKLEIKLLVGQTYYDWSESPLYGYVSGNIPTGSNFVTQGPTSIDFVLRDPPGSDSYSYMEQGLSISKTTTTSTSKEEAGSANIAYHLGSKVEFESGTPFFSIQTELASDDNITVGLEHSEDKGNEYEESETITFNQSFSTSGDPAFVGDMGDLFFGHGNNLIYGLSNFIQILNINNVPTGGETIQDTITINGEDYTIGKKVGLNMGKEVSTTFIYTQNHIKNYLIPNLIMLRNLVYDHNNQYYNLVESNSDSDRFLTNNDDFFVWGSDTTQNKYNGPSYIFNPNGDDLIDSVRFYNNQINSWIQVLRNNEYDKLNSAEDEHFPSNISFDSGSEYEASVEKEDGVASENSFEFTLSPSLSTEVGFAINGFGMSFDMEESYTYDHEHSSNIDTTNTQNIGFALADGDQGDYFSVDVRKDTAGGFGPIFRTVGGQSSCPYEDVSYTEYYEPGSLISQATMRVENPAISADNNIVAGVPETEPAIFNIAMSNNTEVGADVWYDLYVEPTSNPDGAIIKMDGAPISGNPVAILVPAGQTVYKTLTVEKGQLDINDYNNIQVILHSDCQYDPTDDVPDIADTTLISAHFVPACTEVAFSQLYDNWTANYYNNDTLSFGISNYNINSSKFKSISFQYAVPGGPRTTNMVFYKDEADFNAASEPKTWINGNPNLFYNFPLGSLIDGNYQLYLKTSCNDGSEYITEPLNGIIDRVIPAPFGTPQPADGILSYGEDISVKFNEPINSGDLYSHVDYVDVRGMTNGTDLTDNPSLLHDASIHFDGITNNMQVNHVNLDHTNYTIEFWAKRDTINSRMNLLTLGTPSQGGLWVGFDAANHFVIEIDGNTFTSAESYTNIGNWAFYSLSYNQGDNINVQNFTTYILSDAGGISHVYTANVYSSLEGSLSLGYCAEDGSAFNGNIHEFRIWNYARNSVEIAAQKGQILNGYEEGLYSLWPMNEASGTVAKDIAFGRNAMVNATWQVSRNSKALALEGSNVLTIPAGAMAFSSQSDFTVEFWYKMAMPTSNATLLSNGNPEQESNINSWNITATSSGEIVISNNGTDVSIPAQNYLDNQWHHFSMSMNRIGYLSIYLDGELIETQSVSSFEGFGAGQLVAGARWYNLSMNDYYDQYMTGTMDEIRVWNSARTHSQIQRYMNHTLKGDEFGLKAYFPFEDVTIENPSISNTSSNNFTMDTIGVAGDAVLQSQYFTTESPNMKLQRPEVSIPHSYIINNDEVIITPNIQANLIENQILDISIKRVKDMNNNMMASTLSWNAFIDKNQVVWDMQDLQITKFVEQDTTITVNIQNQGGMNESYTISNIPSWMEVSPSSGNLSPQEVEQVEIRIKPELNIGSYQTDINLVASMDYNERLGVSVQVNGHAPDWTVNPSDYSHTANIIGQLSVGNILSTDVNDIVACFVGDECRGVSNVEYFENGNMYLTFMNIYANTNEETMSFKVYDASTGDIYSNVSPEITFTANQLYGSVSSPLPINATNYVEQSIDLAQGWNWVSFNVYANEFNNLNTAFSGLNYQFKDYIKSQTQFASVKHDNNWFGNLTALDVEQSYKMRVNTAQTMLMSGYRVIADTIQIPIAQGWNWIGYPLSTQKPLMEALSSLSPQDDDIIKSQHEFAVYSSVLGWVGSLTYMQAGEGYVMYSSNTGTLNYMTGNSQARTAFVGKDNSDLPNSEQNMTIIANANLDKPSAYEIKAYDENGLCGKSEAQTMADGSVRYFITVNSQSPETIRFEAVHKLGSLEANENVSFEANNRLGTLNKPFELTFDSKGFDAINAISVYPNPFNQQVQLSMVLDDKQTVEMSLFNAIGVQISLSIKLKMDKGYHEIDLLKQMNLRSELSNGVYFVKARINGTEEIIKIVKQ